ncbi:MAG: hypothetical protein JNM22_17105 [Saprospiraceae bacterium]|nr:hypothetical protein [Saprospiraceae bacterium]
MIDINYYSTMYRQNPSSEIIRIEAQLGNPQAECKGFGICTLDELDSNSWDDYRPYRIRRLKALLSWQEEHVHLVFPINGMLVPTRAHFFASGSFLIESETRFPAWLCDHWKVDSIIIPSGAYACQIREEAFEVDLPVLWQSKSVKTLADLKKAV